MPKPTQCPECGAPALFYAELHCDRSPGYVYDTGPGTVYARLDGIIQLAQRLGILTIHDMLGAESPEEKICKALKLLVGLHDIISVRRALENWNDNEKNDETN